jgi:DNA-directed RNA polymerase subunit RPC12/RpoP
MNRYYVDAGQQAGPVDDAQLEELARSGRIQTDTLVWREGMENWQPYRQAKSPGPAAAPAAGVAAGAAATEPTREAVCVECGRIFNMNDMIRHGQGYVCANCKPVFLQKISEGLSGTGRMSGGGTATIEELLARDYEHDLGGYLSQGWETFKNSPGIIIGASVLVYGCLLAINLVPYLSSILSIVLTGPLMGGLWLFYLKKVRGEEAGINDAFEGFRQRFGQLLLGNFIPGLLAGLCVVPMVIVIVIGLIMFSENRGGSPFDSGAGIALVSVGGLFAIVGICGMIYLSTCWMFTLPLVADKGMNFWSAMGLSRKVVIKHWWMTLLVLVVVGLVGSLGALACGIGLLVSGPVAFAALACAYDKLFGDLAPANG